MATTDVFGFAHEDLLAARGAIESALSICLEEAEEQAHPGGCFFRYYVPDGPCLQICRNSGPFQRWQGAPSNPWHPAYGVLVFVHGQDREPIVQSLKASVPSLSFLERKLTM